MSVVVEAPEQLDHRVLGERRGVEIAACLAIVSIRITGRGPWTQPSRNPGARVLEKVPRWKVRSPASAATGVEGVPRKRRAP